MTKERILLAMVENAKNFSEKCFPKNKNLNHHLREALLCLCWEIQEKESRDEV